MEDEIMPHNNIIVVRVDGRDYSRFSNVHEFEKPNDVKALELMNECAKAVIQQFPDIIFSCGFTDEYSFVFKRETKFYQRRSSKILSLIASFFTSVYVIKCKAFFPEKNLKYAPSFKSCVICCATLEVLQAYLSWRQNECHLKNQYNICYWQLIYSGKSENEAEEILKGSQKQDRNELLYQSFKINYKKDIPAIFRQGTCALKTEVEDILKFRDDGFPIKRSRRKVITVNSENIAARRFWNDQLCLTKELGKFTEDLNMPKSEYLKAFECESRFSEVHEFEKPNDAQALNLMNSCAVGILEEFKDIVFSYGVSDEYSCLEERISALSKECQWNSVCCCVFLHFNVHYEMEGIFPR